MKLTVSSLRPLAIALAMLAFSSVQGANLRDLADQLDKLDADESRTAIDKANACTRARDFSCAEAELKKAAKLAASADARKAVAEGQQRLANERQLVAQEEAQRREAERRQAEREAREERERIADERAERRRAREEAQREEDERSASVNRGSAMRSPSPFDGLDSINKAMRDGQRQIVANQAGRARQVQPETHAREQVQGQARSTPVTSKPDANVSPSVQVASNASAAAPVRAYQCVTPVFFDQMRIRKSMKANDLSYSVLTIEEACAQARQRASDFAASVDRGEVRGYPNGKVKKVDACAVLAKDEDRVGLYVYVEETTSSPCHAAATGISK